MRGEQEGQLRWWLRELRLLGTSRQHEQAFGNMRAVEAAADADRGGLGAKLMQTLRIERAT
jgi:hypothetical protein